MIRAFYDEGLEIDQCCRLDKAEAHHVFRVLRAQTGEIVQLLDGRGQIATGTVRTDQTILVQKIEKQEPSPIILYQSILKSKAMDFLIREATAIGVQKIVPVITDHCEVKIHEPGAKVRHWQDIAREACKQSGNAYLPTVETPQTFSNTAFLKDTLVAALYPQARSVFNAFQQLQSKKIGILIGPEGDFSEREYQALQQLQFVQLSPEHVLRSETAALYLLSLVDQLRILSSI